MTIVSKIGQILIIDLTTLNMLIQTNIAQITLKIVTEMKEAIMEMI